MQRVLLPALLLLFGASAFDEEACNWIASDKLKAESYPYFFQGTWRLYARTPGFPLFPNESSEYTLSWKDDHDRDNQEATIHEWNIATGSEVGESEFEAIPVDLEHPTELFFGDQQVQVFGRKLADLGMLILYSCKNQGFIFTTERRRVAVLLESEARIDSHQVERVMKSFLWSIDMSEDDVQEVNPVYFGW